MSIDSYEKYISAADLNNDGIKEIYVYDSTGTTSKYIIGKNGLSTGNDDIDYGQRWYISDFNADGFAFVGQNEYGGFHVHNRNYLI